MVQPSNQEWATVIQGVSSCRQAVPPFIIVKGSNHLTNQYTETNLPLDQVITTSKNRQTTNKRSLEQIQHFNKYTKSHTKGTCRLLVLNRHKSHHSASFKLYYQTYNIITIYMPPHSSYILQPLNISCFATLKKAYSQQIKDLIYTHVNHITKVKFLITFKAAFFTSITKENILGGF